MNKSVHCYPKEGDYFLRDRVDLRRHSLSALQRAKQIESNIQRIAVRIDHRTTIFVPAGANIQKAINRYKKLQPCM